MYGKLLLISQCGNFVAIDAGDFHPGMIVTDRVTTKERAIEEAIGGGTRYSGRPSPTYFIGVSAQSLLASESVLLKPLLAAFEKMQRTDKVEDRITHEGALKLARRAWAAESTRITNGKKALTQAKEQANKFAADSLFNPDLD